MDVLKDVLTYFEGKLCLFNTDIADMASCAMHCGFQLASYVEEKQHKGGNQRPVIPPNCLQNASPGERISVGSAVGM